MKPVGKKILFFLMALFMFFFFYGAYTVFIRETSLAYALDPPDMDMSASPNPVGSDIQDAQGIDMGYEKIRHSEIYERYDFSGFNMHLGFLYKSDCHILWGKEKQFRVGGVLKTPFKADIRHKKQKIFWEHYPDNPGWSSYESPIYYNDLTLNMPLSYGVGFSFDFSDAFTISWDIYQTRWDQYLLVDPNGDELSPISQKAKNKVRIKPTTQVRMGAEYLFKYPSGKPKWIIPLRGGVFYDPEPAGGEPDDFYGVSFGSGLSYRENFCFDFAYQCRFGKKRDFEYMQGETISCKVTQHYFYASIIYYLF